MFNKIHSTVDNQEHHIKFNEHQNQQTKILEKLVSGNKIFLNLKLFASNDVLRQICQNITLLWAQNAQIIQIHENQIYLIFQGHAFEYMQNDGKSYLDKISHEKQYLIIRKLRSNDFFHYHHTQFCPKYKNQNYKKYHLMVEQKTLIGKISDRIFLKYLAPRIQQKNKNLCAFFRKVSKLQHLPQTLFYQLSAYTEQFKYEVDQKILNQADLIHHLYFIHHGSVQLTNFYESSKIQKQNYYITVEKKPQIMTLGPYEMFGMIEENKIPTKITVNCLTNCCFYRIDKRLFAIVVSSFQKDLQINHKKCSFVNINEQIKGQNTPSIQKNQLQINVEKIKASQRRIWDIRLKNLSSLQSKRNKSYLTEAQPIATQHKQTDKKDQLQSRQKIRLIKTSDHRFALNRGGSSKSALAKDINERMYKTFQTKMHSMNHKNSCPMLSSVQIGSSQNPLLDENNVYFSSTQQKKKIMNLSQKKFNYSLNSMKIGQKSSKQGSKRKSKLQSNLIKFYLDKKLNKDIEKKAQTIFTSNRIAKFKCVKNVKRIFKLKKQKQCQKLSQNLGQNIFNRMIHLSQNPLLFKIQNQRKKFEDISKKIPLHKPKEKSVSLKKQKQKILIINT